MLLPCNLLAGEQDPEYCDSVLSCVTANVNSGKLKTFFGSIASPRCNNNAEFQELSNEQLFRLIASNPALFFSTLFSMSQEIVVAVKQEIDHPIHEGIPVTKIYDLVKKTKMPSKLKKKAIQLMDYTYRQQIEMIRIYEEQNKRKWEYPRWH